MLTECPSLTKSFPTFLRLVSAREVLPVSLNLAQGAQDRQTRPFEFSELFPVGTQLLPDTCWAADPPTRQRPGCRTTAVVSGGLVAPVSAPPVPPGHFLQAAVPGLVFRGLPIHAPDANPTQVPVPRPVGVRLRRVREVPKCKWLQQGELRWVVPGQGVARSARDPVGLLCQPQQVQGAPGA